MVITDTITIETTNEALWALTLDVEAWPDITPTMDAVERLDGGPLGVGSEVRISQPGMRPRIWTVRRLDPGRVLEWDTKLGTVTMTARHLIGEAADAGLTNRLELELTGFGSGLLGRLAGGRLRTALAEENAGFAAAAARTG